MLVIGCFGVNIILIGKEVWGSLWIGVVFNVEEVVILIVCWIVVVIWLIFVGLVLFGVYEVMLMFVFFVVMRVDFVLGMFFFSEDIVMLLVCWIVVVFWFGLL